MNNAQLINQDSGNFEYYTPAEIVNAAREVMGSIDLDPASSKRANETVKADIFYSVLTEYGSFEYWDIPAIVRQKGGLDSEWRGNVWLNHPFSRGEAPCKIKCDKEICRKRGYHTNIPMPGNKQWIERLVREYETGGVKQSCNITYASTSEEWFRLLLAYPQCFIHGRTNYYLPDGTKKKGITKGSVVTYLGSNTEKFKEVFSEFGTVK